MVQEKKKINSENVSTILLYLLQHQTENLKLLIEDEGTRAAVEVC